MERFESLYDKYVSVVQAMILPDYRNAVKNYIICKRLGQIIGERHTSFLTGIL